MLRSKKPPVARKFSDDGPFEFRFEHNCGLTPAIFFAGETEGCTSCWTPFVGARAKVMRDFFPFMKMDNSKNIC